jgi:rubredoxin
MTSQQSEGDSLDIGELTDSHIKCPSCRFGKLVQTGMNKWECSSCGYWTVRPPTEANQQGRPERAGGYTPRTTEQKEELKRGREYWTTLISESKKAIFGFLITFSILSFTLNMAVRAALNPGLSLTWAIAAWVTAGFIGIVSILLFASSSTKEKLAFMAVLLFFMITGGFWFNLILAITSI